MFKSYPQSRSSRKTGRLFAALALIAGVLFTVIPNASAAVKSATKECSELSNFTADIKKAPATTNVDTAAQTLPAETTVDEEPAVGAPKTPSDITPPDVAPTDAVTSDETTKPAKGTAPSSETVTPAQPAVVVADSGSDATSVKSATKPATGDTAAAPSAATAVDPPPVAQVPTADTTTANTPAPVLTSPAKPVPQGATDAPTAPVQKATEPEVATAPAAPTAPAAQPLGGDGTADHPYASETPLPSTDSPSTTGRFGKPCKEVIATDAKPTINTDVTPDAPVTKTDVTPAPPATATQTPAAGDSIPAVANQPAKPAVVVNQTPTVSATASTDIAGTSMPAKPAVPKTEPAKPKTEPAKPAIATPDLKGGQSASAPQVSKPAAPSVVVQQAKPKTVTATAETNRTPVEAKPAPKPAPNVSVNGGATAAKANVDQPAKPVIQEPVVATTRLTTQKTITVASATEISLEKVCRLEGGSGWKLKYHNKGDQPEPLHVLQAQKSSPADVDYGVFANNANSFASLVDVKPGESGEKQFAFRNVVAYGLYVDIDIAQDGNGTRLIKHDDIKNDCTEKPSVDMTGECQTSAGPGAILTFSNKSNQTEKFTVTRDGKTVDGSPFEMKAGSENVRKFLPISGDSATIKVTNGKGFVFEKSLKYDCKANVATVIDSGTKGSAVPTGPTAPPAAAAATGTSGVTPTVTTNGTPASGATGQSTTTVTSSGTKVSVNAGQATTATVNAEASTKSNLAKTGMEIGRFLLVAGALVALGVIALAVRKARTSSRS